MPLFEYECKKCGQRFEELVMGSDAKAPHCPSCGSEEVERRLSAPCVRTAGASAAGAMPSASSCGTGAFS